MNRNLASALLLAATSVSAHAAAGDPPDPVHPAFGLTGLARGQSAILNVFWGDPHEVPPNPCHVSVAFVDVTGSPLLDVTGAPVAGDGSVRPGAAFALRVRGSDVLGSRLRSSFRPVVTGFVEDPDPEAPPNPCHGLVPTFEIYDDVSLRTESLHAPLSEIPPPVGDQDPPEPDRPATFGLLGLAEGQLARLSAAIATRPPGPPSRGAGAGDEPSAASCVVGLGFVDAAGQVLTNANGQPLVVQREVAPNRVLVLDARASDVLPRGARRRSVHAVVRAEVQPGPPNLPPNPCFGLVPTLELIDAASGRTSLSYAPAARFLPAVQFPE